ncbi:hypothetical protein ABZ746_18105 [Streptomyces sp. NPDC020096]
MAKNKNKKQERRQPESSRSAAERGAEQAKAASMEAQQEAIPNMSIAHKGRQKRFGHN